MALFNGVIKMHRRTVIATAVSLAFAVSLAMPFSQAQAKDKYHEALRMPTGFDIYLTSVHQVQTGASDESEVLIKGRLTGYLYDNNYEFTDVLGQSIEVELDDDVDWSYVHKDQLIEIYGEVDRNMFKVKIEAKHYRILEEINNVAMQSASNASTAATATPAAAVAQGSSEVAVTVAGDRSSSTMLLQSAASVEGVAQNDLKSAEAVLQNSDAQQVVVEATVANSEQGSTNDAAQKAK